VFLVQTNRCVAKPRATLLRSGGGMRSDGSDLPWSRLRFFAVASFAAILVSVLATEAMTAFVQTSGAPDDRPAMLAGGSGDERVDRGTTRAQSPMIPLSDPEIPNPMRGSYRWYDRAPEPPGWPVLDSYVRYGWRDLEPRRDQYNFSAIDRALAQAQARGGKFGFRVMAANSVEGGSDVPEYLMERMRLGFWFKHPDGGSMYAPDWNDADFLERTRALLAALSRRYADDPRLGFVDIGSYGDFGEWHVYQWRYRPSPSGARPITPENAYALIDMYMDAFPNTRLVIPTVHSEALNYAMSRSPRIGLRVDCLGEPTLGGAAKAISASAAAGERWQTAPVISELCGPSPGDGYLENTDRQVEEFHVAMIGNGNFSSWERFSAREQAHLIRAYKRSGYRFVPEDVTFPSAVRAGSSFSVDAAWSNVGVTPAYNEWDVMFDARDPTTGNVVWQGRSELDLRTLLPTVDSASGKSVPLAVHDRFLLPSSVPPGEYDLGLTILDADEYYAPLALAIEGRDSSGRYHLGTMTVDPPLAE
jgi:hypothetical protein